MNSILNDCIYKCIYNHNLIYYDLLDGIYVNCYIDVYTNEYTVITKGLMAAVTVFLRESQKVGLYSCCR